MEKDLTDIELLDDVGKKLGNEWTSLATYLGFDRSRISVFISNYPHDTLGAITSMLNAWHADASEEQESKRTQLAKALKNSGRNDLAQTVRQSGITTDHDKQSFQESSKETVFQREKHMEDAPPKEHDKQSFQESSKETVFKRDGIMEDAPPRPTGMAEESYKMTSIPRGICLIINNVHFRGKANEREGSEVDAENLKALFEEFGFTSTVHSDATAKGMMDLIEYTSQKEDHTEYDCFVCCILSHGDEGIVFGSDGESCKIRCFTDAFLKCDTLAGKPKLFFVQACQGSRDSKPLELMRDAMVDMRSIPDCADFLVAYSTPPGFVSFRYTTTGSIYITTLIDALRKYYDTQHILDILIYVNNEMSKKNVEDTDGTIFKQVAAPQFTLRKKLFLTKK